jgi:hypothetical protein
MGKPGGALAPVLLREFRFVRYDERGCGLSEAHRRSLDRSLDVGPRIGVDAARPEGPVTLLGISARRGGLHRYASSIPIASRG